uniref:NADH-ubiquinone oxidoreductase chain 2 n=1 Tax=Panopea globosa TaxID=1237092 RepID=A0A0U1XJ65_9BIVA|nr:NADH dehydrogenase subunit 2 [Panopea globosa]AIU56071.1 NADH dehydrogenase subunit 2 [Panopea globosa]
MVSMVVVKPSSVVFMGMVLGGVLITIMSSGVLGVWVGLELNFFGFIPLLLGKSMSEGESCLKYFIIQVLGSGFFFLGVLLVISKAMVSVVLSVWSGVFLLCVGLFLKLGIFPFHFWFPSVVSSSSWFNLFLLSTLQKVGPLWILSGLALSVKFASVMSILVAMTSFVGAIGGLGQVYFRSLLAYSSLVHSGWMGVLCLVSGMNFLLYLLLYSAILGGFVLSLWLSQVSYGYMLNSKAVAKESMVFWVSVYFLSLGGLPPLLGSVLKLYSILILSSNFLLVLGVLIFSSVISLFYYLGMFFGFSVSGSDKVIWGFSGLMYAYCSGWKNSFILMNVLCGIVCLMCLGILL